MSRTTDAQAGTIVRVELAAATPREEVLALENADLRAQVAKLTERYEIDTVRMAAENAKLTATNEGRLKIIVELRDQRRTLWTACDKAEAARDAALKDAKELRATVEKLAAVLKDTKLEGYRQRMDAALASAEAAMKEPGK